MVKCQKLNILYIYFLPQIMGSYRSEPDVQKHSVQSSFSNICYASSHMCGWRKYMESAAITQAPFSDKNLALFGIFDGHGGAEIAIFVERHFCEALKNNKNFEEENYEEALKETFLKMDELIESSDGQKEIAKIQEEMQAKDNGPKQCESSYAGCTANVILITEQDIYCANAGDSRSVASIKNHTVALSKDHKPTDDLEEERINKAGGKVVLERVNGNLNLSRALGDLQYKINKNLPPQEQMITAFPDVLKVKRENIDFIIMGCDGIWEVKSNNDMVNWMTKRIGEKDNVKVLQQLFDELLGKHSEAEYGMDNMSATLIRFTSPTH